MQLIRKNLALKLLAFGLALVGWAYVHFAVNPAVPAVPADQQLSIPITAANLSLGFVARFTDREAVVTVSSKRGDAPIKPDQIKAVLDLSNKGAGIYNVPVRLVAPDLAVQSLSPASVTLTVERLDERAFNVTVQYVGALPRGIVVSQTRVLPVSATVRAPTSLLGNVVAVHADVALPTQPKEIDEMVRPVAVDASGSEIRGLTVSPNLVRVQMAFVGASPR